MTQAMLTTLNGHMNDYQVTGLEDGLAQFSESLTDGPAAVEENREQAAVVVAEATAAPYQQPAADAQVKVKATKRKAKGRTRNTTAAKKPAPKTKAAAPKIKYVPQAKLDAEVAELEKISRAARTGDTAALDELRRALDECNPYVWRRLADLQILLEQKLIALVAGEDPLRVEAFRKRCSELRHDLLEGETGSLATKMAASRVVSCWMLTQLLELRVLESPDQRWPMKDLELAEKRHQTAMRTLGQARQLDAQLRRMAQQQK